MTKNHWLFILCVLALLGIILGLTGVSGPWFEQIIMKIKGYG